MNLARFLFFLLFCLPAFASYRATYGGESSPCVSSPEEACRMVLSKYGDRVRDFRLDTLPNGDVRCSGRLEGFNAAFGIVPSKCSQCTRDMPYNGQFGSIFEPGKVPRLVCRNSCAYERIPGIVCTEFGCAADYASNGAECSGFDESGGGDNPGDKNPDKPDDKDPKKPKDPDKKPDNGNSGDKDPNKPDDKDPKKPKDPDKKPDNGNPGGGNQNPPGTDPNTGDGGGRGGGGGGGGGRGNGGDGNCKGNDCGDGDDGTGPILPGAPELYKKRYENGIKGVWDDKSKQLKKTPLGGLASRILPTVNSGECPRWMVDLNLGGRWNFGTWNVAPPCWIWPIMKAIVICCALIFASRLIFGGA